MKECLVSIIVPIYNAAQYIERCIKSVIGQTYKSIEIILVDDGSTDESYEICKIFSQIDNRIKLIKQINSGVVSARNRGFVESQGKYILFVDADDWIEPNMIQEMVENIGEADIVSTAVLWEKYPGKESYVKDEYPEGIYAEVDKKNVFFSRMIFDLSQHRLQPLTPWIWNKLFKRKIVESVYKEIDQSITFAEDTVFIYKSFFKAESFVIMHNSYYHYCYNENSVCHKEQRNILSDINKVYISLYDDCKRYNPETRLFEQLQNWIVLLSRLAINNRMRFEVDTYIPEFLLDTRGLEGKKSVVVYGAGQAGKDYCQQLKKLGYEVVLWVDSNYECLKKDGLEVESPEKIKDILYDIILISVSNVGAMEDIKKYLISIGVEDTKIIWKKPIWY